MEGSFRLGRRHIPATTVPGATPDWAHPRRQGPEKTTRAGKSFPPGMLHLLDERRLLVHADEDALDRANHHGVRIVDEGFEHVRPALDAVERRAQLVGEVRRGVLALVGNGRRELGAHEGRAAPPRAARCGSSRIPYS